MAENQQKSLFFSWQSDTNRDCNWNAISQAARQAIVEVENELGNLRIEYLESTSNTSGGINIPDKIFQRINDADIILCDITTINQGASTRKTPNPNVSIELGYAAGVIGWDRIIMVFNEAFGSFPLDVPFDISHHRIIKFKIKDKSDTSAKGKLKGALVLAIKAIIEKAPPKLFSVLGSAGEKRKRDISTLSNLLSSIHLPTYNLFLADAPKQLNTNILHYWHGFDGLIQNTQFHLYDRTAAELVTKVHNAWDTLLAYGHRYRSGGSNEVQIFGNAISDWHSEDDLKRRVEKQQAYQQQKKAENADFKLLQDTMLNLQKSSNELFEYIKENYVEIDLEKTSDNAFRDFKAYHIDD